MSKLSPDERMERAAEMGGMTTMIEIRRSKSRVLQSLEDGGIEYQRDADKSPFYAVSWDACIVEGLPKKWTFNEVSKANPNLTQGQRLWLMATEARNNKINKK